MIGAIISCVGMPAARVRGSCASRAAGELVRGSITRASLASSVVMRDADADGAVRGQLLQQIDVARDQGVLGDDADRLAALGGDFQAAAGELELALGRLVAIGDAGEGDRLRPPVRPGEPLAQQLGGAMLHQDLGFEVEAGAEAQVLVARPGVAVAAAVGAAAVGIDAVAEADVGAVVFGDDRLRLVGQVLGRRAVELRPGTPRRRRRARSRLRAGCGTKGLAG